MSAAIVIVFIIGYLCIALEHPLKIDKSATALITGVLCWVILVLGTSGMPAGNELLGAGSESGHHLNGLLSEHFGKISEILFFLLGAMTIVELVDAHDGFHIITDRITTTHPVRLLWLIVWITFFLSAVLDNLTTAIVISALLRKIIHQQEHRWVFGGFAIIAANAGGAWSPIGDVTTIMLWIGGQVTTLNIIRATFLASIVSLLVPLLWITFKLRKQQVPPLDPTSSHEEKVSTTKFEQSLIFLIGCLGLLWVPVFKTFTHLPPYMGILFSLGVIWVVTEWIHRSKASEVRQKYAVSSIIQRIDTATIIFFLGILLAVASLEVSGHLRLMADGLNAALDNMYLINGLIGVISSIVDNVPLVAACMGMYDFTIYPPDHDFWELLAYCAGTGGSILIIGSAAGVASMSLLKIDFVWYLRRISAYALLGYLSGIGMYYLQHHL